MVKTRIKYHDKKNHQMLQIKVGSCVTHFDLSQHTAGCRDGQVEWKSGRYEWSVLMLKEHFYLCLLGTHSYIRYIDFSMFECTTETTATTVDEIKWAYQMKIIYFICIAFRFDIILFFVSSSIIYSVCRLERMIGPNRIYRLGCAV